MPFHQKPEGRRRDPNGSFDVPLLGGTCKSACSRGCRVPADVFPKPATAEEGGIVDGWGAGRYDVEE